MYTWWEVYVIYEGGFVMKKTVKAGPVLDLAGKALDALFRGLDKALSDLGNNGLDKKKEEDIEKEGLKGKYLRYETSSGHVIEVELFTKPDAEDQYLIQIQYNGGKGLETPSKLFKKSEISDYILKYAQHHELIDDQPGMGDVKEGIDVNNNVGMQDDELFQNTRIAVTLQRVSAGKQDTINLCAINASNAVKAMSMLDTILSDDEFVATITSEPMSFAITETENSYDVQDVDTVDTSNTFEEMLKASVECYHNLQCIHWAAKGSKFNDIHSYTESLMWDIKYQIDTIAEWCVEFTKKAPNVLAYQYTPLDPSEGCGFESAMSATKGQIDDYVKVLECYYVNVDHDVQSVMDNWIRDLKKKSNYVLDRTLMLDCTARCADRL